jgi:hypothetical protein
VLGRHNFSGDLRRLEDDEAKPARAAGGLVVRNERLQNRSKILEVGLEIGRREIEGGY